MRAQIFAQPYYIMWLTVAQLDILKKASKLHYDHKCKAASELGGFLYGWANCVPIDLPEGGTFLVTFKTPELQTCLKILEWPADARPEKGYLFQDFVRLHQEGEKLTANIKKDILT